MAIACKINQIFLNQKFFSLHVTDLTYALQFTMYLYFSCVTNKFGGITTFFIVYALFFI